MVGTDDHLLGVGIGEGDAGGGLFKPEVPGVDAVEGGVSREDHPAAFLVLKVRGGEEGVGDAVKHGDKLRPGQGLARQELAVDAVDHPGGDQVLCG